jgi:hypothetical protein
MAFYFLSSFRLVLSEVSFQLILFLSIVLNYLNSDFHKTFSLLKKYSILNWNFLNIYFPHYFVEIILYFVYFISSTSSVSFLMFYFVCLNLEDTVMLTYQWYQEKFNEEFISLKRYMLISYVLWILFWFQMNKKFMYLMIKNIIFLILKQ